MTEPTDVTPGEQPPVDPQQQEPINPAATPPVDPAPTNPGNAPVDWEARYKGSVSMVERLTIANRDLTEQQQLQNSENEQLKAALASKEIEQTVAVGERDKNLENVLIESAAKDTELAQLRAHKAKVDLAKELGHPELISILDSIPTMDDPEVQKTVMMDFVQFREDGIQQREKMLLSGITPPVTPIIDTPVAPTTTEGWQAKLSELDPNSPEHRKVSDQWYEWERQQEK